MQAIILAAGRGERLAPLTENKPKAMVEAGGRPIFWRVVDSLVLAGVTEVIAVTSGYALGAADHAPSGLRVKEVIQAEATGTASALAEVGGMEKPFLLLGCDTIFPVDHIKALVAEAAQVVLSVKAGAEAHHNTITYYQGGKVAGIAEKPPFPTSTTQSLMLYKLPPLIFDYLPQVKKSRRGEYEVQDAINSLLANGVSVGAVECERYFHLTQVSDFERY